MKNKDIYNFLISLARDLNRFYKLKLNKQFKPKNKGSDSNYDPVTIADKKFEKFIRTKISKKFPQHSIIGEEFGLKNKKSDYSWVIDPIDGTRSFVIGYPSWSNLIAFCYKNKPIMGLANFPILNKFYINQDSKKAFLFNGKKKIKLRSSNCKKFKHAKISGDFHGQYSLDKLKKVKKLLPLMQFPCMDALSYSHFCEGKIDTVFQSGNKIWDIYPLIPIIKASGGTVTNWENKENFDSGNVLISSSRLIHKQMLKMLKPLN